MTATGLPGAGSSAVAGGAWVFGGVCASARRRTARIVIGPLYALGVGSWELGVRGRRRRPKSVPIRTPVPKADTACGHPRAGPRGRLSVPCFRVAYRVFRKWRHYRGRFNYMDRQDHAIQAVANQYLCVTM